jgi:hypothetical protein
VNRPDAICKNKKLGLRVSRKNPAPLGIGNADGRRRRS